MRVTLRRAASDVALVALVVLVALAAASPAAAGLSIPKVEYGKHLFGQYCVMCHGALGQGITPSPQYRIGAGPQRLQSEQPGYGPSLRGVGALAADFYLRMGYMPLPHLGVQPRRGRVLFSNLQIQSIVAYIASLAPGPPIPKPHPARGNLSEGQSLFTEHCAGCHQVVAQGGYVTGAVPPPLEDASSTQIAEAVRIGPYVMPKFDKRAISDKQLNSIIRYVQFTKKHAGRDLGGWGIGDLGPVPEGLVTWFIAGTVLVGVCILIGERLRRE